MRIIVSNIVTSSNRSDVLYVLVMFASINPYILYWLAIGSCLNSEPSPHNSRDYLELPQARF